MIRPCHGRVITYCLLATTAVCFRWTAADGFFTSVAFHGRRPRLDHHGGGLLMTLFHPSSSSSSTVAPKASWMMGQTPARRQRQFESLSRLSFFKPTTTTATILLLVRGGGDDADADAGSSHSSSLAEFFVESIGASTTKCWILLITSITLEAVATSLSKQAHDIKSVPLFLAACVLYLVCMVGFNVSLAKIDVGVAYAAWSAIGTLLVTTMGIVFFQEDFNLFKALCLAFIIFGVVGLNLQEQ